MQALLGATTKEDAVAAAQAATKQIFDTVTSRLKEAMPGNRFTDFDLKSMAENTPNIGMEKDAINVLMNNMRNIALSSREAAQIARKYGDWSVKNNKNARAWNRGALDESTINWLRHKGLISDPGEIDVKKGAK